MPENNTPEIPVTNYEYNVEDVPMTQEDRIKALEAAVIALTARVEALEE